MSVLDKIVAALAADQAEPAGSTTSAAERGRLTDAFRYASGMPLVRKHRDLREGWSFLCPVPTCQKWHAEFQTVGACRTEWFRHCAEPDHDPDFVPSWPPRIPFEQVTQPICFPGAFKDLDALIDLAGRGQAVDRTGRPLTFEACTACPPEPGWVQHKAISGMTCVQQVPCPKCGAGPGVKCDRSTRELSPIDFGRDKMASGHGQRFKAAAAADDWRWDAGDMTMPAEWAPQPAPTKRRYKAQSGMLVTLTVDVDPATNELWRSLVGDYDRTGRVTRSDSGKCVHISFPSAPKARWSAGMLTTFYDIPESAISITEGVREPRHGASAFTSLVKADAVQVLAGCTDATPDAHLAWAAGVLSADDARNLVHDKLTVDHFADIYSGRSVGNGLSIRNERTKFTLETNWGAGKPARVLGWPRIIGVIQGRRSPELLAEMRTALQEAASFPRGTVEYDRAVSWSGDLAMQAWMAVRPDDLAPYVPVVEGVTEKSTQ